MAYESRAPSAGSASRAEKPGLKQAGAVAGAKHKRTHRATGRPGELLVDRLLVQQVPSPMRRGKRAFAREADGDAFRVVDDLSRPVPVGRAELDVLETYLGQALDAILREIGTKP
ncbi:hypothetical protein HCU64_19505 [Methylobacterium sp. C25]|uniref:hypothetical protein n=1 Tax=Methylobacterium sp. C25 TaxID=2721622 RepID=UPI001F46728D|nr:hypothetical protein [Methylobacterium sp. C25]MCE4225942.1 hypothetical protein [Methylobacterium sp. C25]